MNTIPVKIRRLATEIRSDDMVELRIEEVALPMLAAGELLVRVEAAPLNPSDMGSMLMAGDVSQAQRIDTAAGLPAVRMPVPERARALAASRIGAVFVSGNEGAGTVVAAGDAAGEKLIGQRVAAFGGGMYCDYKVLARESVVALPSGASARDGAAIWVNPITALAMVEVMRSEGADALVHTAAASSLGQILQRICVKDGIPLINIVRRPEQVELLRGLGAAHVLDSTDAGFFAGMVEAFAETNATLAFDAVGGGTLAGTMLTAMEAAQNRRSKPASHYGSTILKQVYVYGRLDLSPTAVPPTVGMAWGLKGFLLPHFLAAAGKDVERRLIARVLDELTTTFAIHYSEELALEAMLDPAMLMRANAKSTNEKFLLRPVG